MKLTNIFLLGVGISATTTFALPKAHIITRQFAGANKIIPVVVGGQQDTFVPNVVTAAVGDVIQFQFANGNHTVTQSSGDAACQPLQQTVATAVHSGHIPFKDNQTEVGTFNMPVTATTTMFFYCATGPHCQEGQTMVVNPADDLQALNFMKNANGAAANIDGTTVVGGTVGSIPLSAAAFVPAPARAGGGGGGGAPPAAAPAASSAPVSSASVSSAPAAEATTAEPAAAEPGAV